MNFIRWPRGTAICVLITLMQCVPNAWAVEKITLWPTIFFLRGQDLCQFEDAYGASRNEMVNQAMGHLKGLISLGVNAPEAVYAIKKIDELIDKNKAMATEGLGMDITLEATLKASINAVSRNINPQNTRLEFANPGSAAETMQGLKNNQRYDSTDTAQLSKVKGYVWGTYSYSPGCRGDVLVTIHVVLPKGESVSFQDQGRPESVMQKIGLQMVRHFQKTSFPTMILMDQTLPVKSHWNEIGKPTAFALKSNWPWAWKTSTGVPSCAVSPKKLMPISMSGLWPLPLAIWLVIHI
jgi:hypothetical protein